MSKLMIAVLLILVAGVAVAAGPYTHTFSSGTGSDFVALVDTAGYAYPVHAALYFGDADVTVSYWDYTTSGGWVRKNNDGGAPENVGSGDAKADSVSTIPAGLIERPDFDFKAIYVTRSTATSGVVKWFK